MLIPDPQPGDYGCHVSLAGPKPTRCAGRKCSAWVVVWPQGNRVTFGPTERPEAQGTWLVKAAIGRCGLLPLADGEEAHELAARVDELRIAGVIARVPRTVLTPATDPFFARKPAPTSASAASAGVWGDTFIKAAAEGVVCSECGGDGKVSRGNPAAACTCKSCHGRGRIPATPAPASASI